MKNTKNLLLFLLLFISSYFTQAQDVDFTELGRRIATTCASIKPGDVVVIYGGKIRQRANSPTTFRWPMRLFPSTGWL